MGSEIFGGEISWSVPDGSITVSMMLLTSLSHPREKTPRLWSNPLLFCKNSKYMKSLLMMLIASCGEGCVQDRKGTPSSIHGSLASIRSSLSPGCTHTGQRRGGRVPISPRMSVSCSKPLGTLPRWFRKKFGRHSRLFPACMENLRQPASVLRIFFCFSTKRPKDGDGHFGPEQEKHQDFTQPASFSDMGLLFVFQERPSVLGWECSQHKSLHQQ